MTETNNHYITKTDMHQAFLDWWIHIEKNEKLGLESPPIPDYIVQCFILLATKNASHTHYNRYPYKDDLINEAVSVCIAKARKYNPYKTKEPFCYYTTTCLRAFWQYIAKEYRQANIQEKLKYTTVAYVEGEDNKGMVDTEKLLSYCDLILD